MKRRSEKDEARQIDPTCHYLHERNAANTALIPPNPFLSDKILARLDNNDPNHVIVIA